jgi:hypothetical protein
VGIRFKRAECGNAAKAVAYSCNKDWWTSGGSTFNIGTRGTNKGVIAITLGNKKVSRSKKRTKVWVTGVDENGAEIEVFAGTGTDEAHFLEKMASDVATLQRIADKKLAELNSDIESFPATTDIVTLSEHDLHVGDTIIETDVQKDLDAAELRIHEIVIDGTKVTLQLDKLEYSTSDNLRQLSVYSDELGIYPISSGQLYISGADDHFPGNASDGQLWYRTDLNEFFRYNATIGDWFVVHPTIGTGPVFPIQPAPKVGDLFDLTALFEGNPPGLYRYSGTAWEHAMALQLTNMTIVQSESGVTIQNNTTGLNVNLTGSGITIDKTSTGITINTGATSLAINNAGTSVTITNNTTGETMTLEGTGISITNSETGIVVTVASTGTSVNISPSGVFVNPNSTNNTNNTNTTGIVNDNGESPHSTIWLQDTYTPYPALDMGIGIMNAQFIYQGTMGILGTATDMAILQFTILCLRGDGKVVIEVNAGGYVYDHFVWLHDNLNYLAKFTIIVPKDLSGQNIDVRGWAIEKSAFYGCNLQLTGSCEQYATHSHVVVDTSHTHAVTETAHAHAATDPSHSHATNDPQHTHTPIDAGHEHATSDPEHTHAVDDPGHSHPLNDPLHEHATSDPGHAHGVDEGIGHEHAVEDPEHTHSVADSGHTHVPTDPKHIHAVDESSHVH